MLVLTVTHDSPQASSTGTPGSSAQRTETGSAELETQASPSPVPRLSPAESAALAGRVQSAIEVKSSGAQVGMEVFDRHTNTVVTSLNADRAFPSMSVVKLFIAIDVIARDDDARPSETTQARISQMLSTSDDHIASSF